MTMFPGTGVIMAARKSQALLAMLLDGVDQATGSSLRDGGDGWTCVEVVCHLRDFEEISLRRVRLILEQEQPSLPLFDVPGLAAGYAGQELATVLAQRTALRAEILALLAGLPEAAWERVGVHPTLGAWTVREMGIKLAAHDVDHLEQIARILGRISA
jgi:hypothetical protein